ncbi:MAG: hypothetical protein Q4D98_12780 [Planctomycetia bacterium]|nr:hypothetical protein [Planctomycetia bacterium]
MSTVNAPCETDILEPTFPVRFENGYQTLRHLVKHVLDGRDEKWEKYNIKEPLI